MKIHFTTGFFTRTLKTLLSSYIEFVETKENSDFFVDHKENKWFTYNTQTGELVLPPTSDQHHLTIVHNLMTLYRIHTLKTRCDSIPRSDSYLCHMQIIGSTETNRVYEQEASSFSVWNKSDTTKYFYLIYISESGIVKLWDDFEIPPNEFCHHPSPQTGKRFTIDPFSPNLEVSKDRVIVLVSEQQLFDTQTWSFDSKGYLLNESSNPDLKYPKPNTNFAQHTVACVDLRFDVMKVNKPSTLKEFQECVNKQEPRIIYSSEIVAPSLYKFLKRGESVSSNSQLGKLENLFQNIKQNYKILWYKENVYQICLKFKNC